MRDILLKRNELKNNSIQLRTLKFDPTLKNSLTDVVAEQQGKVYNKWKFYDRYIKAREEAKNEIKSNNVGKTK